MMFKCSILSSKSFRILLLRLLLLSLKKSSKLTNFPIPISVLGVGMLFTGIMELALFSGLLQEGAQMFNRHLGKKKFVKGSTILLGLSFFIAGILLIGLSHGAALAPGFMLIGIGLNSLKSAAAMRDRDPTQDEVAAYNQKAREKAPGYDKRQELPDNVLTSPVSRFSLFRKILPPSLFRKILPPVGIGVVKRDYRDGDVFYATEWPREKSDGDRIREKLNCCCP